MLLNKLRRLLRTLTFLCITCLVLTFIIQVTEKVKTIYQGRTAKFESQFLLTTKYSAKLTSFEEQNFLEIAKRNWLNDKYLIVSLVNFAHWELALNLMLSLKKCGIEKFLAICLDSDVFAKLNETKTAVDHIAMVPSNWLSQKLNKNEGMWDSQHYVSITHAKTEVVAKLLSLGFTVFFNDVDIVWISSEVLSYIEANASKKAEIIFTWDGAHMNTGCYIVKPSKKTKFLFAQALIEQRRFLGKNDQFLFNAVLERLNYTSDSIMHPLDKLLFPNGCTYFRDQLNRQQNVTPMIVHANCLIGAGAKRSALKTHGMWYL